MTKTRMAAGMAGVLLVLLTAFFAFRSPSGGVEPTPDAIAPSPVPPGSSAAEPAPGYLYGRVTAADGATYQGRLRFGDGEEAFWGDYFNGVKEKNPWAAHAPLERESFGFLGLRLATRERPMEIERPFMARFGDLARIEARGRDVRVTLKSGTAFDLNRFDASDFDDGVTVWDGERSRVVELDSMNVASIELRPAAGLGDVPGRLHGTVRTRQGEFTGFVQWDRAKGEGGDALQGRAGDRERSVRFDTVRSIARRSSESALVTLHDGREIELSGSRDVGAGHRGIYVDDGRYGRVLVSWDAFERIDFTPAGSGPAYGDFPPGRPLTGTVTARDGRRLSGRLVYDFDESETTETFDAPAGGVDYTIPFGMIGSIEPPGRVILRSGEELQLESRGDLGEQNAGILVFTGEATVPERVPWGDVMRVDLEPPPSARAY